MDLLTLLIFVVLVTPYLLLFYKEVNLRIRLLFVSLAELSILCTLIVIDFFGNGVLANEIFFYNQYVWLSIFLNIIVILFNWLFSKITD